MTGGGKGCVCRGRGGGGGGGGCRMGLGLLRQLRRSDVKTKVPCGEEAELWEVLSLVGLGCVRIEL